MSIQPSYSEIKNKVCRVCSKLFSEFNEDYITVTDKSCDEVSNMIRSEVNDKSVDISKYVYVVETNGCTLIKR